MKSPTSLIRFRNAVGVVLALSAIFAVVISTFSLPGDRATAQEADEDTDAIEARAEAWWNSLNNEEMVNALRGNAADHDATTPGRQLGDPTRTNTDPSLLYDEDGNQVATGGTAGVAYSDVENAQRMFDDLLDADKTTVQGLVNGDSDDTQGDIYAVGDHLADVAQALRGFQSVELWWNYIDCTEARTAVGEDNNALVTTTFDDPFTTETETGAEPSAVCEIVDVGGTATPMAKAYSELDADTKAQVDEVGQAILGLDSPGSPSSAQNNRAEAWWDKLNAAAMVDALYGDGATDGDPTRTDTATTPLTRPEKAQAMYANLDDATKTLVNDRWEWIYSMGGANDMGIAEVIYWWDSIDNSQRRVAVGVDNEPQASPDAVGYSADWDDLNPADGLTDPGQARQARVLDVGQAILGTAKPVPQVAAWWNTLNADQMVYVVYGNPPMRTPWNDDGDDGTTPLAPTVTDDDKAVFQKMYADLADDDGIRMAAEDDDLSTHLPTYVTEMLARNGLNVVDTSEGPDGDDADTDPDYHYYSAKAIVNAIANEIFDPPTMAMAWARPDNSLVDTSEATGGNAVTVADDDDFDWPYHASNGPANVGDWWETTDCRVMRIAVGQDNQYLNAAIAGVDANSDGDFEDEGDTAPVDAETSIYCGHFPGATAANADGSNVLSEMAQERVAEVGAALLGLSLTSNELHANRPSFNDAATGDPVIMGTAQVGATLEVNTNAIADGDGIPTDADGNKQFDYQWLRNGNPIPGATGSSYILTAADAGATISIRVSFVDDERYPEVRTSPATLATSLIVGAPGEISKIEEAIRGVTVSAGDNVILSVKAYGLQGVQDQKLSAGMGLAWKEGDRSIDDDDTTTPWEIRYKAPSSPGTYTVTASFVNDGDCRPDDEEMRADDCTATFEVRVRRPSASQPPEEAPVNPPGDIPGILADSDGNQYEVFTPVEGGTFSGEGYSLNVPSGAVPNGEFIGIRMSDDGAASNAGMTHQRYTLGGNMYGVHAVDSSGDSISSYVLDDPATVCLPLPDELRQNISDLAVVAINGDGSLTILSAQVRISTAGTMVCGGLSNLPASVAVGSAGAPAEIPTPTPEPTPVAPETGGTAPASSTMVLWALLLGVAVLTLGSVLVISRRRESVRK